MASVASNKTWGLGGTHIPGNLSLGWLLFTLLLGIYGISILFTHKGKIAEIAIGAGLVYFSAIVPIFIGMLGRMMTKKSWYPWVVAIDIIGPILIAIGMIFSKPIEYIGVTLFACNIVIYTSYLLTYLRKTPVLKKAAVFLTLSCLTFYTVVVLSMLYPLLKRMLSLTILDFIPVYGSLHAFGFVLCGLIGWAYIAESMKKSSLHKP